MGILKAPRYSEGVDPRVVGFLTEELPYLDFTKASFFYSNFATKFSKRALALLGCNDRYFLLTVLMRRVDAIHPWIYERAREVEARPDGYLDLWARYHYKSTLITFAGGIQDTLIEPELRTCIFSNSNEIARPFIAQIKEELEANEYLKDIYADVLWEQPRKEAPSWSIQGGLTVKREGNPREQTFEGHGVIDALPTGKHFPKLIYDDIITESNVTNPEQVQKATERTQLSFALGVGGGTRKQFVGTRYSYADSYGYLIEHKIAEPRLFPATHDGTLDGTPVFMTQAAWDQAKREMRSVIAAQMLQNPLAGEENTFRVQWLKGYMLRPRIMNVYITGDPSAGRHKTSDRTAIAVIGYDTLNNRYLLDGYCHRMQLSERWDRLYELWRKWSNMTGVQMVKCGWERYGFQSDHEYFAEKQREVGHAFQIEELAWAMQAGGVSKQGMQSKKHRVGRLEPDFRNGNFFVPGKVWHSEYPKGATWKIDTETEQIIYSEWRETKTEKEAKDRGEPWRCFDPIRRLDEDRNVYDLTRVFFEEYRLFPFAPRDDLIDAMSRIYDMEPNKASLHEKIEVLDWADA